MSGWSTRATTAAAHASGSAPSPAASEEPMPDRQSGLWTVITPSSGTSTAPVTTTTGAVPPSRSSATPRSTSRLPPTSTSAFGPPSRLPSPAASSTPAILCLTPPYATSPALPPATCSMIVTARHGFRADNPGQAGHQNAPSAGCPYGALDHLRDITDFGLANRDETGVIMTKIRDKSAGGELSGAEAA